MPAFVMTHLKQRSNISSASEVNCFPCGGCPFMISALWEGAFEDPCFYVYAPMRIAALSPTHISMDIIPFKCSMLSSVLMRKEKKHGRCDYFNNCLCRQWKLPSNRARNQKCTAGKKGSVCALMVIRLVMVKKASQHNLFISILYNI